MFRKSSLSADRHTGSCKEQPRQVTDQAVDTYFGDLLNILAGPAEAPDPPLSRGAARALRRGQEEPNVKMALPLNAFVKSRRKRKSKWEQNTSTHI